MAESVRKIFKSDYAISTTGVAGPGKAYGKSSGSVWLAIATKKEGIAIELSIAGDRATGRKAHIGSALRQARISQGRTLRDVAKSARVSLGYLSEVERGQKEASSELLNSICQALELSLLTVISDVSIAIRATEAPSLSVVEAAA
ncbi:MAG: CinA family protein [Burkholderiaceae bacterium]|nr:CinA family protein [Burkholderiaceae bacterium]